MYKISHSRLFKTSEAAAFQALVHHSYKGEKYEGDVEVFIEFHRKPLIDCDNCSKAICDSLEGVAYKRDRQITKLSIDRYPCEKGKDYLYVSVQPVE